MAAGEFLTVTSHCGTHVDAPYHYFPTCEGKPSRTIDEMPLEWFFNDGVVLDFTDKPDGYMFEPEDLQEKLDAIGYTLKPFDIVLIRCDADKRIHDDDFVRIHGGISQSDSLVDRPRHQSNGNRRLGLGYSFAHSGGRF
jgi:kynurenine formamidase